MKSEYFTKASARGKNSHGTKGHDHHLGKGDYALKIPKWRKMDENLLAQGIIPVVYEWLEQLKNWYHSHEGTIYSEDGTLEFPPSSRDVALQIYIKNS
jgi:hypothetical protein